MKVMILGSGAREHALAWKISQSPRVEKIYAVPGNAGTASLAQNLKIPLTDIERIATTAEENAIDLVVVGPEGPLAAGIVDRFELSGIPVFGPTKGAARIESSKVFARNLMQKWGIPCPNGVAFDSYSEAAKYVETQEPPFVVKADGLAAGKGVVIAQSRQEAHKALRGIMIDRLYGVAGEKVVIEECVQGREVSLLAFTDGDTVSPMVPACDYKRVFDNDEGPNTGGMGSYSPPGFFDASMTEKITDTVLTPVVKALAAENTPYKGVLYAGIMLTDRGPLVLEFNARFGDPETQAILSRLKTDLTTILQAVVDHNLSSVTIEWSTEASVGTVMASGGYPADYRTGLPISGLENVDADVMVFHAGTRTGDDGLVYTDGGRVLTVTARGNSMLEARNKVYRNLPRIHFQGAHYRKDIAAREVS